MLWSWGEKGLHWFPSFSIPCSLASPFPRSPIRASTPEFPAICWHSSFHCAEIKVGETVDKWWAPETLLCSAVAKPRDVRYISTSSKVSPLSKETRSGSLRAQTAVRNVWFQTSALPVTSIVTLYTLTGFCTSLFSFKMAKLMSQANLIRANETSLMYLSEHKAQRMLFF